MWAKVSLFLNIFAKRINNEVYVSIKKQLTNFKKLFPRSVSTLPERGAKVIFPFKMFHRAKRCPRATGRADMV